MADPTEQARLDEWFVPRFGPLRFRAAVGLLFLPYTGMVLAFTVLGSMLAAVVHWDRVLAVVAMHFLALGIGGHALDALGSGSGPKPWGSLFSKRRLWLLAAVSVLLAYAIAIPYMLREVPLLWGMVAIESFFLFAYNLEWFGGRFHSDGWFAVSWGCLPVLAGYVMQSNRLSLPALAMAAAMALVGLVEIKASRPYKALKRAARDAAPSPMALTHTGQFEAILKALSLAVVLLALALMAWRWSGAQ